MNIELDLMMQYSREFGHTFSVNLYHQLTPERKQQIDASMTEALAGRRGAISDRELFPAMDFDNKRLQW